MISSALLTVAVILVLAILLLLAVFQVALAAGAPWGRLAWGGQHRVLPRRLRIGSAASVAIYALIALVVLDRAGRIDVVPDLFARIAMWVVFAYFVIGIVMNALSKSRLERSVMVPVTILLAAASLAVALS